MPDMRICGTCIHYRCEEEPDCYGMVMLNEYCARDRDNLCAYTYFGCDKYTPDEDYIEFMNRRKENQ